jgi:hypothetical protein
VAVERGPPLWFWLSARVLAGGILEHTDVACVGSTSACNQVIDSRIFSRVCGMTAGSSLIEYSFLITLAVILVVAGVAAVGIWAANVWTNLLPALPP